VHPDVAQRVLQLLKAADLHPRMDMKRAWDHGVFVPLKLMLPEADVPIVQLSVCSSQDAELHLRMGEALAPLRDENVAIVGSGMTFHNMSAFRGGNGPKSNKAFDDALVEACQIEDPVDRRRAFASWREWPQAEWSHPMGRAEHWTPMLVVVGAGLMSPKGQVTGRFKLWDFSFSSCFFA
jgi:4,5-DOPA dioxygenase extradiol